MIEPRHLKHKELNKWYREQEGEKSNYRVFIGRVIRYWYSKEEAIKKEPKPKKSKTLINEKGRVCLKCWIFKERDNYSKNKKVKTWRLGTCKECMKEIKREYRYNRGGIEKDREYKRNKRHLEIGEQVFLNDEIREVIDKKFKRGVKIRSLLSGNERRLDPNDNKGKSLNSIKFERVRNPIREQKENIDIFKEMEKMYEF